MVGRILEYTAMAANALQDVAAATQIPFLGRVCTLSLAIIPMVRVWKSKGFCILSLIQNAEYQISKRAMPPDCRGNSSFTLHAHDPVCQLGANSISKDA
jgi:hypothetical protein